MDLMILKKRIDGFRLRNGQLQKLPPELLFDLRQAWEQFTGPAEEFRRELGMKVGTLRNLLTESKKLNHVLASAEAVAVATGEQNGSSGNNAAAGGDKGVELIYDGGSKVIRFPDVSTLVDFLKRAS